MKREEDIKKVIAEKQRQIELIQKNEAERSNMKDNLQSLFLQERQKQSTEMQEFLAAFQKQREQTQARKARMSMEQLAELQEQKDEAQREYEKNNSEVVRE